MTEHQDNNQEIEKLKQEIILRDKIISKLEQERNAHTGKISELEQKLANLNAKMQQLLHERYGRKSEKIPDEVLPVMDEAAVTPEEAAVIEEAEQAISVAAYTRKQPKRKPIPSEFERETIIHDLPLELQVCSCGCQLHCIGEDRHEQLDYVLAKIKVISHIRKKYGCRDCEIGITMAPVPKDFIPKSLAAPGLLAHVILSKYEDHLPLYRQEKIPQSTLGKAIYYFVEHWEALVIYLEHGFLDIDNNFTEQHVKPFTIGRKNWCVPLARDQLLGKEVMEAKAA